MLEFANEKNIKLPKGGLIIVEQDPRDHILGATALDWQILQPDGQWVDFLPVPELQRAKNGDTFGCVSFSCNNNHESVHKRKYGHEINKDDKFLVVGSGTVQGKGNSVKAVADWNRLNGFIKQKYDTEQMTLQEFYSPNTPEDISEGLSSLVYYEFAYRWVPTILFKAYCSTQTLMDALRYSPLQVSVDGQYEFDNNGYVGKLYEYTHEVNIVGYKANEYWIVFDSETNQLLKFRWDYLFGYPMAHNINKVNMKIVKKKGQPAIYFLNSKDGLLVPYSDGVISGGDMFKIFFGDYKYAPTETLEEYEFNKFQIAPYKMTTIPN